MAAGCAKVYQEKVSRDLLNIFHAIADKGAKSKSLHDPWCDTSTPQGELLVTILACFATFERHLIKARTDEGRKRAKARGVRFGRPRKLDPHQRQEASQPLANGETLVDVARTYAVDPTTICYIITHDRTHASWLDPPSSSSASKPA